MDEHHIQVHSSKKIRLAFFLNLLFTIVEVIGGIYVNSVAILSDAVHDLGDSLSLGTAWYLQHRSNKKPDQKFSYGYHRFSLLGALITGLVLVLGSVYIIFEAIDRIVHPEYSDANGMMYFAIAGVVVNGFAAYKLHSGTSMNEKVMSWHLVEDVLGWVAVLIVSIILQFYSSPYLDPALSLLITAFILFNVVRRLNQTIYIFLQGHPKDVDRDKIQRDLLSIHGIDNIHHLHIWSLDGENHVFTTHIVFKHVKDIDQYLTIKQSIYDYIRPFGFSHSTIQIELDEETCFVMEAKEKVPGHHHKH